MLFKIIAIGIFTVIISMIIKQYRPDFALIVNICGGLVIVFLLVDQLSILIDGLYLIGENSGVSKIVLSSVVKVIIASYLTEFCVDIAEDSGNKFVASKVLIGGKISICVMAFPIIKTLFTAIISLI